MHNTTACLLGFFLLLPASASTAESIQPVGHTAGYELVWQDEFDGEQLDRTKWAPRYSGRPRAHTINDPSCITLDGKGNLVLTTRWDEESQTYRIGHVGTAGIYERRYGYFECRLRFQQHQGHHGSFWLQSDHLTDELDNNKVSGTEVDIIEHFGTNGPMSINLHWNGYGEHHKHLGYKAQTPTSQDGSDDFHVYACLWTEDEYVFYIDGKEHWRTSEAVSGIKQYMILSLLSSGWEKERIEKVRAAGGLPDSMLVDYVRVFRQVSDETRK